MLQLHAALNGDRAHPAAPRTPEELAAEARAAVGAGAATLHLHPYDDDGLQTLAAEPCAAALHAVRAACPGIPISLSTSEGIEPDDERRLALVAAWTALPDLVTANQGEAGILELCELLVARGIGIEAGLADDGRGSPAREPLAEGEGFEPSVAGLPLQRFSRPPDSTTLAPLRDGLGG